MSRPVRGCFVTGTDTDVGKTVVGTALVRGLRARGMDVGVLKPIETGVGPDRGGDRGGGGGGVRPPIGA